jgi:hypothetical protein
MFALLSTFVCQAVQVTDSAIEFGSSAIVIDEEIDITTRWVLS